MYIVFALLQAMFVLMVVAQKKKFCSEDTCQCPQYGVYMIMLFAIESGVCVAIL